MAYSKRKYVVAAGQINLIHYNYGSFSKTERPWNMAGWSWGYCSIYSLLPLKDTCEL